MRRLFHLRRAYLSLILITTTTIIYVLYLKKERRDFIQNYYNDEVDGEKGRKSIKQRTYMRTMNKIRPAIKRFNIKQEIYNTHLGAITSETIVVVIQCHSNVNHLERLLNSLRKVFLINTALLIFSHDYYSDKMNKLIQHINFAMYMQIFYPYSIQLHPEVFPGVEHMSCIEGVPCVKSMSRNPEAAQSKHHWWWQANQIFDHLRVLQNFSEPILFLEANNYMILDGLFVYRLLVNVRNVHCPFCEIMSLAAYQPELSKYKKRKNIVTIGTWKDNMSSTAIAFDRKFWQNVKSWKELFCFYNDSKWDSSLKNLGAVKMEGNIYVVAIDGPRVFRIDECDVEDVGCKERDKVQAVKNLTNLITKKVMFPWSVKIKVTVDEKFHSTESGNWSDARDHELCMRFANESVWFIN